MKRSRSPLEPRVPGWRRRARPWRSRAVRVGALLAFVWATTVSTAHESPSASASVVQRDAGHYVLAMNLDVADALRRTLQPAMPPAEFQAVFSAMGPEEFAGAWARATAAWVRACTLEVAGQAWPALRWRWPPAPEVQARIRERLMHGLTQARPAGDAGGGPAREAAHGPHLLVQAQAEFRVAGTAQGPVKLVLHPALRPLAVTSYRPQQQWVGAGDGAIALRF